MRTLSLIVVTAAAVLASTCAKRPPEPSGVASGSPHVSWIIKRAPAAPGSYPITFALVATVAGRGTSQPIQADVPVLVK
jgi:hypothetical protein